jgi:dipeptide/tripeptide permease
MVVALGWVMVLPAALAFAVTGRSSAVWLVVALVITALSDIFKRFRRIDWAYLDPTK